MSSLLLQLTCALAAAGIAYVLYIIYYQYTYWKRHKILHLGLVPILGNNAPIFLRQVAFPYHMQNLYKKFPGARYYGIFDFKTPTLLIKDPELIQDLCIKNFDYFTDHDAFVTEEMDPIAGRNLFSLKGERWKQVRNTLSPSFTAARMKIMFELIAECSNDFVQYFVDNPEDAKSFEAKDVFSRYTSDVVATAAYGVKFNSMNNRDNEFYFHGKAANSFTATGAIKFELLRNFPKFMHLFNTTFFPSETDKFFKNLIKGTVKTRKENGIVRQDMIHLLMLAMEKEDGVTVTVDDIIGQAFFFFLAGFDTSSSFMCFTAHELAANPDIQERLYQEIEEQLLENNGKITYDSLTKMKYLDMILNESLRKYPPAPFTNRLCNKDYVFPPSMEGYPEYRMEKGTTLLIPIYGFHRDPKYFPDPDKFDPERFSSENKSKIVPCTYMPFGVGPRQCIANRFAMMETKIVIINLLKKFVIKFTKKSRHPIVFGLSNFNLTAKDGIWLELVERKKTN